MAVLSVKEIINSLDSFVVNSYINYPLLTEFVLLLIAAAVAFTVIFLVVM